MHKWSKEEFKKHIYNSEYEFHDPEYLEKRPKDNSNILLRMFYGEREKIRHLDYGGGNGYLSKILANNGFDSMSFDPYVDKDDKIKDITKFNLVTAFEVFEHSPDISETMNNISNLIDEQGIIFLSTKLSDGQISKEKRLDWWYASPRNGHISIFSNKSLFILAKKYGFDFASMSDGYHILFRKIPEYAKKLIIVNR